MPEHDFELYLKLFANLLDLDPGQREAIRDELRDHMEERLAELSELGVPREEAIERALDEFGDAAGLAGSFTQLASERKRQRRLAMYRTTGTAVVVALVILGTAAMWPQPHGGNPAVGPRNVVAQDDLGFDGGGGGDFGGGEFGEDASGSGPAPAPRKSDPGAELRAEVETALDKPVTVAVDGIPFRDAVKVIADEAGVDVLFDNEFFEDIGIDTSTPVEVALRRKVPARVALDLLIDRLGGDDLGYVAREGFVYLTSMSDSLQLEVYDVRDLVGRGTTQPRMSGGGFSGGGFGGGEGFGNLASGGGDEYGAEGYEGGMGSMMGSMAPNGNRADVEALVHVVVSSVARDTWEDVGGPGAITGFDGLLVVRNSPRAHRDVRQLLEKLRTANAGVASAGGGGRTRGR